MQGSVSESPCHLCHADNNTLVN